MSKEYLIRLPWPPKELNPNFKRRHHWRKYQPATKAYREECWGETLRVTGASPSSLPEAIPIIITFCPPDYRRRDDDGMIGAFKAGRDGVADALGVDDNRFKPTYEFSEPVKGGAVLVHVCPAQGVEKTESINV